jgi:hypothetical protein
LLCLADHETKAAGGDGANQQSGRTKEGLNYSNSGLHCLLPAETVSSECCEANGGSGLQSNLLMHIASSNVQQTSAVIEGVPKTSPVLPPALSSPVRKGHGHRHRRAVRCASGSGGGDGSGEYLTPSPTDIDPREPQTGIESECLLLRRSAIRLRGSAIQTYFRPSIPAREDEKITLETFSTIGVVGSPAHSDLSSLSSYKETSPESESCPPPVAPPHLVELTGTERCRRPIDVLKSGALSHSRDSLETYKARTFRRSADATSVSSDKIIVHRDPSDISLEHVENIDVTVSGLPGSRRNMVFNSRNSLDRTSKTDSKFLVLSESQENEPFLNAVAAVAIAAAASAELQSSSVTNCSCEGSQSESKSESSHTLTAGSGINSRTTSDGANRTFGRKSRHGRAKSVTPITAASKLLFNRPDVDASMEHAGAVGGMLEVGPSGMTGADWLSVSTDSDDTQSSGT